jgi:uncharacterized protein (TIGR03067 family)
MRQPDLAARRASLYPARRFLSLFRRVVMKYALMIVAAGLLVAASPQQKDDAKKDTDKVQGTWVLQSIQVGGETSPNGKGNKMVVTGEKFAVSGDMGDMKGTIKLDPAKNPKEVEMNFMEGGLTGKSLGVYSIDGDELKLSMAAPDSGERPKELSSKAGSTHFFIIFKRETK